MSRFNAFNSLLSQSSNNEGTEEEDEADEPVEEDIVTPVDDDSANDFRFDSEDFNNDYKGMNSTSSNEASGDLKNKGSSTGDESKSGAQTDQRVSFTMPESEDLTKSEWTSATYWTTKNTCVDDLDTLLEDYC